MRFCSAWLVLVLGPTASAAEATPFTFGFVLSYTSTVRPNATLGTVMTLDVIVENHPSMDTQSFLFNDVVSLLVGTNGGYRHAYLGGGRQSYWSSSSQHVLHDRCCGHASDRPFFVV
jgi:hypothetical protein